MSRTARRPLALLLSGRRLNWRVTLTDNHDAAMRRLKRWLSYQIDRRKIRERAPWAVGHRWTIERTFESQKHADLRIAWNRAELRFRI